MKRPQIPAGFDWLGGRNRDIGVGVDSPVSGRRVPLIATARPKPTRQIRRSDLEQFRQSVESWQRQGQEAGRVGDVELATGYAEDVADLRAILRLFETEALEEAAEAIDCLDTLVRDQNPIRLYDTIVPAD